MDAFDWGLPIQSNPAHGYSFTTETDNNDMKLIEMYRLTKPYKKWNDRLKCLWDTRTNKQFVLT